MKTKLRKISPGQAGQAVVVEVNGEPDKILTEATRDSIGTHTDPRQAEKAVQDEFRKSFPTNSDEVHVHKNRNGTYCYAVGLMPSTWPEDGVQ